MIDKTFIENKYLKNFVFLGLGQAINQFLPLLVIPIFLPKIGITSFGYYSFFQYIILYIALFINFGFLLSATKSVVIIKSEKEVSFFFSSILYSKILNFTIIIFIAIIGLYIYPLTRENYIWYLIGSIFTGIGYIFYQDWLFQGKQNNFLQFICIVFSKIIYLVLLFAGIKWFKINLPYLIIIDSISILTMGILSHTIIHYHLKIKLESLFLKNTYLVWKEGAKAFTTMLLTSFFTSINVILLGFFCTPEETAIYAIADRIFILFSGFFAVISRVIFPGLARIINHSEAEYQVFFNRGLKLILTGVIFICIITLLFENLLVKYLLVKTISADSVISILNILLIALIFQTTSSLYSYQFILKSEYKTMNFLLMVIAFINILLAFIIIPKFGALGAAFATTLSFIFYLLGAFFYSQNLTKPTI